MDHHAVVVSETTLLLQNKTYGISACILLWNKRCDLRKFKVKMSDWAKWRLNETTCCCWLAPGAFDEGHSPLTPTPLSRNNQLFLGQCPPQSSKGGCCRGAVSLAVSDLPKVTRSRQRRLHTSPHACSALTAIPCTNKPAPQENRTRDKCMRVRCVVLMATRCRLDLV